MKRILIIGPFPNPITGQSLANKIIKQGLENKNILVDILNTNTNKKLQSYDIQGKVSVSKILRSLLQNVLGILKIIIKKYDVIYLTPGQTYLGFLKNSLFIIGGKLTGKKIYIHFHGGLFGNMYRELSEKKKKKLNLFLMKLVE